MPYKISHSGGDILCSSIFVYAKPKRSISIASDRILSLPNAVRVRQGTDTEILIKVADGKAINPILQLGKNSIRLRFFFTEPNRRVYGLNLGIFISLLSYLDDLYDIDMKPLYPQLIESISGISDDIDRAREYSWMKASEVRIRELSRSNIYLSNHIHGLAARLRVSDIDCSELRGAMLKVIGYLINRDGEDPERVAASMQVFGFGKDEAEKLFAKCGAFQKKGILHAHKA